MNGWIWVAALFFSGFCFGNAFQLWTIRLRYGKRWQEKLGARKADGGEQVIDRTPCPHGVAYPRFCAPCYARHSKMEIRRHYEAKEVGGG